MVVLIALAIAFLLHQLGRRVEDVFWRQQRTVLLGAAHRRAIGLVGGIRFRRGGDIDHRLRDREFAFRATKKIVSVLGGVGDHQRLRIGEPDILDRHPHHAPRQKQRVLAGIEHARQIIQRGVGIGAAHRFMQRGDQVVVAVGGLVVDRRAALQDLLQLLDIEHFAGARRAPHLFGQRQRGAAIAIGHPHQRGARFVIERQRSALDGFGAGIELFHRGDVERVKHQHPRARQERRVQLKRRVFGGGADQHHGAVFHHRQKGILLRLVEAMDLVDEQQRALPHLAPGARGIERLFQIGDAGKHRGNLLEMQLGGVGEQPRHGGLAGAGRAPKHQRAERARFQHARQRAVRAENVILANDIGERARPQTIRQRMRRLMVQPRGAEQAIGRLRTFRAHSDDGSRACHPSPLWGGWPALLGRTGGGKASTAAGVTPTRPGCATLRRVTLPTRGRDNTSTAAPLIRRA